MNGRLQRSLAAIDAADRRTSIEGVDTRARLIVSVVFLAALLSVPLTDAGGILIFALYPIIGARLDGIGFGLLFRRSLIVLPFIVLAGAFNPLIDREPMFIVGGITVSRGWVTLVSILLRGVISVQAVLLLILSRGFIDVCRAMGRLGVPHVLTAGLMMIYRYIFVVAADGQAIIRSVEARRTSAKALPLRLWAIVVGQLLVRSLCRAERIGAAMRARGFDGRFRSLDNRRWSARDTAYTVALSLLFATLRILNPSTIVLL